MKGDPLDGTFLFKIDVFQERSVFNVLIRGAHYGTPSRSPLALWLTFLYISVYLGKFLFFDKCALFLCRVQPAAAKSLWETRLTADLVFPIYDILISDKTHFYSYLTFEQGTHLNVSVTVTDLDPMFGMTFLLRNILW